MNKFVVVVFPDEAKANEGAEVFRALHEDGSLTLYGLAFARKTEDGEVQVVEEKRLRLPRTAVGALAGALVGLIGGPLTAALGAAGGAWIGTWRDIEHLGVGWDFLEEVANAMTPGATALVADVSEDRIAFIDEQMSRLDGVVLRQWQSELPEMRLAAEAAARKTELEQLVAERQDAAPARKEVIALRIEKAEAKLKRIADEAKEKLEQLDASTEERLETLERQLESAGPNARLSIERRIEETRKQRDRRAALLKQTIEVAEAALAA